MLDIFEKVVSFIKPSSEHDNDTHDGSENVIDLKKTFNSDNVDIIPIIKKILHLPDTFPDNILASHIGNKYNELEFFKSNLDSNISDDVKTVFQNIDRTQTQLGRFLLQSIILTPLHTPDDISRILQNRQSIIQSISQNTPSNQNTPTPILFNIRQTISRIKVIERDLLAMFQEDTPEMREVYNLIYFEIAPLRGLNYNETFMKIFYYFIIIFSPLYGIVSPFLFICVPYLFMRFVMQIPITFETFWIIIKNMIMGGTGFFNNLNKIFNSPIGTGIGVALGGESTFSIKSVIFNLARVIVAFMGSNAGSYLYVGFLVVSYLYGVYNSIQVSIMYNKVINMLHSRLNILSKWIRECNLLYTTYREICMRSVEMVPVCVEMEKVLKDPMVVNLVSHGVFREEPGLITNKGMIIKTFREFLDAKKGMRIFMEPFCQFVAYLDMYSALGFWLRESDLQNKQSSHRPKSFCNYILDSTRPQIHGSQIWNICCSPAVCNDINLGYSNSILSSTPPTSTHEESTPDDKEPIQDEALIQNKNNELEFSNMLITGPNGTGKSTYIKSIIECIILGQTIGIVPAAELSITPFANITTYLNIPDCQGKESLFQAEMNRCLNQLKTLEEAEKTNKFSFNIMDEIFVSTNYQEGMSGAYAVINQLGKFQKCLNIITTHYDTLANMANLHVDKRFFDIEINEKDGKTNISKDYKIRPGISKKHMALKLLKLKGFNPELIKDAEDFYERLQAGGYGGSATEAGKAVNDKDESTQKCENAGQVAPGVELDGES